MIPAHNEGPRLPQILSEFVASAAVKRIIVVDDGSTDGTTAHLPGSVDVIRFDENRGKAAALTAGLDAVQTELAMMADADLVTLHRDHIWKLGHALEAHDLDMAVGIRDHYWNRLTYRLLPGILGSVTGERLFYTDDWRRFRADVGDTTGLDYAIDMLMTRWWLEHGRDVGQVYLPGLTHLPHHAKKPPADAAIGYLRIYKGIGEALVRPL